MLGEKSCQLLHCCWSITGLPISRCQKNCHTSLDFGDNRQTVSCRLGLLTSILYYTVALLSALNVSLCHVFTIICFLFPFGATGTTLPILVSGDREIKIGLKEFTDIQSEAEKAQFFTEDSQTELIAALKCFDSRGDNTVSKDDLSGILSDYDDSIIDDLLKAVSVQDDGRISITGTSMFWQWISSVGCMLHEYLVLFLKVKYDETILVLFLFSYFCSENMECVIWLEPFQ